VVNDQAAFQSRYGSGLNIAGQYESGQLSNNGELLQLQDAGGNVLAAINYGVDGPWPSLANGHGSSLEVVNPLGSITNPSNWRSSVEIGGSPGSPGTAPEGRIVFNEILASSSEPQGDQIELRNRSDEDIDLSGWFVSDAPENLKRFQIPAGTILPASGYLVIGEAELGFGLDHARGGQLWLVQTDSSGRPLRFAAEVSFNAAPLGISVGPSPADDGSLMPLARPTFGAANAGRWVSDVIISEVHYEAVDPDGPRSLRADDFRFIELHNHSSGSVDIGGWQLEGSAQFAFPQDTTMGPGESIVVVSFDVEQGAKTAVFQFQYGVAPAVRILGDFDGDLNDDDRSIRLVRAGAPAADDPRFVPTLVMDEVQFGVDGLWPSEANGLGLSLTRTRPGAYGLLPGSWTGSTPSPGTVDFVMRRHAGDANEDGQFDQQDILTVLQGGKFMTGEPATWSEGDWNGDEVFDQLDLVAALQDGGYLRGLR
jgi:hypothetical protein